MTIVKRNNNWNNLLDDLLGNANSNFFERELNVPPVNIQEGKDQFQLDLVAPGLQKQDFKLSVDDGLLTIAFTKEANKEAKEEKLHRQEFIIKSFKRTFTLDDKIDTENIEAKYENGILQISLPKRADVKLQPKEINIQ